MLKYYIKITNVSTLAKKTDFDIANFVKKTDFDDKPKNLNESVASKNNKLNELMTNLKQYQQHD